jgi:hypothetical protein
MSEKDAVAVGLKIFALSATEAVWAVVAIEADVAVSAIDAVAKGDNEFALSAIEADWIEPEATTFVNNEPSPIKEPVKEPVA